MTSKWNILAPIASSHRSEECIQHAASVATAFGADLHLLRVIDPRDSIERGQPEWCSSAEQNCQIVRAAMESSPAATIAAHAESMDADLVVMTSSVYGKWSRLWRRSVTEQVMRLSRRRVCVTSERSVDPDFRFRTYRILCVVGLDGGESRLIEEAQVVAERSGADLVLLHVVPDAGEGLLHYAVESSSRPLSPERATDQLLHLAARLRVRATTTVMTGNTRRCIARAAREHRADLVIASRAHRDSHAVYGGDTLDVLPRLHCPMLTIPLDHRATVRPGVNRRTRLLRMPVGAAASMVARRIEDRVNNDRLHGHTRE